MRHRRCAFLTMDSTEGWSIDADLGIAPLEAKGWTVDQVPWRSPDVDWNAFDAIYIGTPWDYPQDVNRFIDVLKRIDRSRAVLVNDLALVHWGLPKTYLRDLEKKRDRHCPQLLADASGGRRSGCIFRSHRGRDSHHQARCQYQRDRHFPA